MYHLNTETIKDLLGAFGIKSLYFEAPHELPVANGTLEKHQLLSLWIASAMAGGPYRVITAVIHTDKNSRTLIKLEGINNAPSDRLDLNESSKIKFFDRQYDLVSQSLKRLNVFPEQPVELMYDAINYSLGIFGHTPVFELKMKHFFGPSRDESLNGLWISLLKTMRHILNLDPRSTLDHHLLRHWGGWVWLGLHDAYMNSHNP
jgi:hypothetical protein